MIVAIVLYTRYTTGNKENNVVQNLVDLIFLFLVPQIYSTVITLQ